MLSNSLESNLEKAIKSFSVVGLNPDHIYHSTIEQPKHYIERIDIIKYKTQTTENLIILQGGFEKRIRLMPNGEFWLRVFFTDDYCLEHPPITGVKTVECDELSNDYIVRLFC